MIRKVKLGDVCDLSIGFVGTVTTQYEEGGIPCSPMVSKANFGIKDPSA